MVVYEDKRLGEEHTGSDVILHLLDNAKDAQVYVFCAYMF